MCHWVRVREARDGGGSHIVRFHGKTIKGVTKFNKQQKL